MEPVSLNLSPEVFPPITMTWPLGNTTALANCRAKAIEAVGVTTDVPLRTSTV